MSAHYCPECGHEHLLASDARAPLDVERLARALRTQDREQEADFNAHGRAYTWERKAAGIAREYVALEEPTP
jgi:predicted  nucleic acid-binding Zn-ribbon protein